MAIPSLVRAATAPVANNLPLTPPPNGYAPNNSSTETDLEMQRTSGVRNRQHQGPPGQNIDNNESTVHSDETLTPTSSDGQEEAQDRRLQPSTWDLICQLIGRLATHNLLFPDTRAPPSAKWQAEYNKVKPYSLEESTPGIPRLASLQDANDSFCIFRRFGNVTARILINKEIELEQLQAELHELNEKDKDDTALRYRLKSIIHHEGCDPAQQLLLERLEVKINEYYDLLLKYGNVRALDKVNPRHHRSVHNYITRNRSIRTGEEKFLYAIDDFAAARGSSDHRTQHSLGARDMVEDFVARRPRTWLHKWLKGEQGRRKSKDNLVHYFSDSRLAILTNGVLALLVMVVLLIPVFVLFLAQDLSRGWKSCVVGGFWSLCMVTVSVVIDLTPENLFIGMATYSAVLVALLSNLN